ncbi:MAG: isonitrile hydratase [Firmicutes bacterium]|nr:isonitrile hydratase [Bacillota bacterium]
MIKIGIVLFPQVEELDFVAPFEVLSYINKLKPGSTQVMLAAETLEPITAFNGLKVIPDITLAEAPQFDIIVIPGGKGRIAAMKNPAICQFVQKQSAQTLYTTSVCTGAFILAGAGLLTNKKATTYHTALDELAAYSVKVKQQKVVQDGNIITAAGVSSGLELGLYVLKLLFGLALSQEVANKIEYPIDVSLL